MAAAPVLPEELFWVDKWIARLGCTVANQFLPV
jgi:hypothetical protein